jgi:hypothetical protein
MGKSKKSRRGTESDRDRDAEKVANKLRRYVKAGSLRKLRKLHRRHPGARLRPHLLHDAARWVVIHSLHSARRWWLLGFGCSWWSVLHHGCSCSSHHLIASALRRWRTARERASAMTTAERMTTEREAAAGAIGRRWCSGCCGTAWTWRRATRTATQRRMRRRLAARGRR